jgi:glycosyltransferase A (GT-A) superfamily protein (DUF2064 family)
MRALVMAKAPVAGQVKTRLGRVIGMEAAARVAAAALLDTLAACRAAFDECHLALSGDLRGAEQEGEVRAALMGWSVHSQHGTSLGQRLARAHTDVTGPGPTVQIGMDTPQATAADLVEVAAMAEHGDAVLGPATDGGWWVLALSDSSAAAALSGVRMSRSDTFLRTREALSAAGQAVAVARELTDVDTVVEARQVAASLTDGRFLDAWRVVSA